MAAGANCSFSISFAPTASGNPTGTVSVGYNTGTTTSSQQLYLSGSTPVNYVTLTPASYNFGSQTVNTTSAAQNFTLTNSYGSAITLSSITTSLADYTTGGNCPSSPSTLAANASCTVSVTFTPSTSGTRSATLTVNHTAPGSPASASLTGTGTTTAPLSSVTFTPASLSWGSIPVGQTSSTKTLTLTNNQSTALTISSLATGSEFVQTATTCPTAPATVAANGTCTVTLAFRPLAQGTRSDSLTVTDDGPNSPQTAALSGTGSLGPVIFSPTSLAFPQTAAGSNSAVMTATLSNPQSTAASISGFTINGPFTQTNNCPSSLAPSASCTVSVTFSPAAAGNQTGTVNVNLGSAVEQLYLSGTATAGSTGGVTFTPATYNFGTVAPGSRSTAHTFTLTNGLQSAVTISSVTSSTADFTPSSSCGSSLAAGASCNIAVTFAPATSGAKSATLSVVASDGGSPHTAALSGTGGTTSTGGVTLSPKQYNFGNQIVGATATSTPISLANGQSTALTISSIQIAAPFAQTNNCGTSLAAGASCTITLTYKPTAAAYSTGTLTITDNASSSPQSIPVTGNGIVAVGIVPKIPVYFSNQLVNHTSTPQTVTVTNNQSVTLNISSITSTPSFPVSGNCVGAIAPNASCTINVAFDPQAATTYQSTVTINDDAPGSPQTFGVQGTGIPNTVVVNVGPYKPCILPSSTVQYTATVVNSTNTAVKWYVDSSYGGSTGGGTITQNGLYTAPATTGSHTIRAVSQAVPSASGTSPTTITSTPAVNIYPYTASILPSGQQTFQAQICGVPQSGSLTYTVDGIAGGNATVGTVTSDGVYTAPTKPGKHYVKVTDTAVNSSSTAVATVYSNVAVDFGSRTNTTYPVPADAFGSGRVETLQTQSDMSMIKAAGITVSRTYAQIPVTYATQTPNWKVVDGYISALQTAGIRPILQIAFTPPWLQPNPNPCGAGNYSVPPTDLNAWAQIAASYVAHMDSKFPGFVQDYEIWNEPDAGSLCTSQNHLQTYIGIYAAAAPAMKKQAAADGVSIRIGGPALASATATNWLTTLLSNSSTAPYVDFVSYHQYLFGQQNLNVSWDSYTGSSSMYQRTQDPALGAVAYYNKVANWVKAGQQPLGAKTPIYIDEFNTNWAFFADCCRNDATYAPVWNALYISDLLNTVYSGTPAVPSKLVYFATNAYPYFCLLGTQDANMDCQYSIGATGQTYPQYYTFQLLASTNYLGLQKGGYLAPSVTPPAGGGGLVVSAFYNDSQDAILITNPTGTDYAQVQVSLQNTGYSAPQATLYQIVNGSSINSSSLALTPQGSNFTANIAVPRYSVQAISLKGQ